MIFAINLMIDGSDGEEPVVPLSFVLAQDSQTRPWTGICVHNYSQHILPPSLLAQPIPWLPLARLAALLPPNQRTSPNSFSEKPGLAPALFGRRPPGQPRSAWDLRSQLERPDSSGVL